MKANTVRDLGALARSTRRARGLTQADVAHRLGVSREWVVRFEQGHPRLEAQKVLDALSVLGLNLHVDESGPGDSKQEGPAATPRTAESDEAPPSRHPSHADTASPAGGEEPDPFDALFARQKR